MTVKDYFNFYYKTYRVIKQTGKTGYELYENLLLFMRLKPCRVKDDKILGRLILYFRNILPKEEREKGLYSSASCVKRFMRDCYSNKNDFATYTFIMSLIDRFCYNYSPANDKLRTHLHDYNKSLHKQN